MNKSELIKAAAAQSGMSQAEMGKALDAILGSMEAALLKEESVVLIGFGSFSVKERPAREGVNPQSGQKIKIDAKKVVKFAPSKSTFVFECKKGCKKK